jgi:hypothetical protein
MERTRDVLDWGTTLEINKNWGDENEKHGRKTG